jgi:hypothetical protein
LGDFEEILRRFWGDFGEKLRIARERHTIENIFGEIIFHPPSLKTQSTFIPQFTF